ncbi:MAG TPA: hypothetical protein VNM16_00570, partial [Bacillota bacterium]|nr:hypothetical protein [Bacillota bacterium]
MGRFADAARLPCRRGRTPSYRLVAVAAAAHFSNDALGNVYPVLVPLMMGPLHMGLQLAALVASAHRLTQNLLQ